MSKEWRVLGYCNRCGGFPYLPDWMEGPGAHWERDCCTTCVTEEEKRASLEEAQRAMDKLAKKHGAEWERNRIKAEREKAERMKAEMTEARKTKKRKRGT